MQYFWILSLYTPLADDKRIAERRRREPCSTKSIFMTKNMQNPEFFSFIYNHEPDILITRKKYLEIYMKQCAMNNESYCGSYSFV